MPRAKKTWAEKMKAKPPHFVILDKDFAGIPKGSKLHISSPEIATALKRCIQTCGTRSRMKAATCRKLTLASGNMTMMGQTWGMSDIKIN